jgi:hypothetical protein
MGEGRTEGAMTEVPWGKSELAAGVPGTLVSPAATALKPATQRPKATSTPARRHDGGRWKLAAIRFMLQLANWTFNREFFNS